MNEPKPEPVVRARAEFTWSPPDGGAAARFTVTLYDNDAVSLDGEAPYMSPVVGSAWDPRDEAIRTGGFWARTVPEDAREHLSLKATNALRRALGLSPHPATPNYPGAE